VERSPLPGNPRQVDAPIFVATEVTPLPSHCPDDLTTGGISINKLFFALLFSSSFLLAQDNTAMSQDNSADSKGQVVLQGCVSRSSGDYTLMKQNPAETYELQATNKIKLKHYLGQRVEVTGTKSASMSTSSDAIARMGSPSSVTFTITSIKTLDKDCSAH
jgi:hypothetical protein